MLCRRAARKEYSIFIIGGKDGIAEKAKRNLEKDYPAIKIVGIYTPPFGFEMDDDELDKINCMISDTHPDLLIVCFGCPKQENGFMRIIKNMMQKFLFVLEQPLIFSLVMLPEHQNG